MKGRKPVSTIFLPEPSITLNTSKGKTKTIQDIKQAFHLKTSII